MSSETSNGYLNDADSSLLAWQAFEEEADFHSAQLGVKADTGSQRNLLLSHNEALAGTGLDWTGQGGAGVASGLGKVSGGIDGG